jgi:hypothetical protein
VLSIGAAGIWKTQACKSEQSKAQENQALYFNGLQQRFWTIEGSIITRGRPAVGADLSRILGAVVPIVTTALKWIFI